MDTISENRACVCLKDIQCITGRNERYGRKPLHEIKVYFGKQSYQFITSEELAGYSSIKLENVTEYL